VAKQNLTNTRSQRTKIREKTEKTQTNTQRLQQTNSGGRKTGENTSNPTTQTKANLPTTGPAKRNYIAKGAKICNKQGGKASTQLTNNDDNASVRRELKPTTRRQSIRQSSTAAKHPPTDDRRPTRPGR